MCIRDSADAERTRPSDIRDIFVRGKDGSMIPLDSLISVAETLSPRELNHFGQRRAVTITANLAPGYTMGEALSFMEQTADRIPVSYTHLDVYKRQLLVGLDAATQSAEFEQARANLRLAQANLRRSQELIEKKFLSQQALDNTRATLEVQTAAMPLAQAKLDKTRIRAPLSGVVGIRNVSVGN